MKAESGTGREAMGEMMGLVDADRDLVAGAKPAQQRLPTQMP